VKPEVLKYLYRIEGGRYIFLKTYMTRIIRNRIIDPNTNSLLGDGFKYYDEATSTMTSIPCDDSNWCEYQTYKEGFNYGVLSFPFSLKLHNEYFKTLNSIEEFDDIMKRVIEFRCDEIKRGWAIKYGFAYKDVEYPELETLSEEELLNWKDPRGKVRWRLDDIEEDDLKR